MDEFISMISQQLGVGENASRSATGGMLKLVKDKIGESAFGDVLQQLPGAETLVGEAEDSGAAKSGGGGLMGSLTSMAGSLMGDSGAGGVVQVLGKSGIGLDKASGFLSAFVTFLKQKLVKICSPIFLPNFLVFWVVTIS